MRSFKITGWSCITQVRRNNFFKNPEHIFVVEYNNIINFLNQEIVICYEKPSNYEFRQRCH